MAFPGITSLRLFKWTVTLLVIPTVLLLVMAGPGFFLVFGGGWAYAGTAGCHFVLNPLGAAMVAGVALGVFIFLYIIGRNLLRRYQRPTPRVGV